MANTRVQKFVPEVYKKFIKFLSVFFFFKDTYTSSPSNVSLHIRVHDSLIILCCFHVSDKYFSFNSLRVYEHLFNVK